MHSACPTAAAGASLSSSDAPSVANTFGVGQKFAEFGNPAVTAAATEAVRLRGLPHYPSAVGQAAR